MLPETVLGFTVERGRLIGGEEDLPSLSEGIAMEAWRDWAEGEHPPFYVRCQDAFDDGSIPFDQIRRLSGLGELWVDALAESEGDVMDLAFSGAGRLVFWQHRLDADELHDMLEAGELGVLGVDFEERGSDLAAAVTMAQELELVLLLRGPPAAIVEELPEGEESIDAYQIHGQEGAWSWRLAKLTSRPVAEDEEEEEPQEVTREDPVDLSEGQRVPF